MRRSKRQMRRLILSLLNKRLQQEQTSVPPIRLPEDELVFSHQLDALLAFRSDPYIDELKRALERLGDGTFGICLMCKNPIEQHVLDVEPTRSICRRCEMMHSYHSVNQPAENTKGSRPEGGVATPAFSSIR